MEPSYRHDAFVSYSRKDQLFVEKLVEKLRGKGLKICWDVDFQAGSMISFAIERAITTSRAFLLVMSENSVGYKSSGWVSWEQSMALYRDPTNHNGRLVPVKIDDVNLPQSLQVFKYLALKEPWDESHQAFVEIVQAVRESDSTRVGALPIQKVVSSVSTTKTEENAEAVETARKQYEQLIRSRWILGVSVFRIIWLTVLPSFLLCIVTVSVYFSPDVGGQRGLLILIAALAVALIVQGSLWSVAVQKKRPLAGCWWIELVISLSISVVVTMISLALFLL